MLALRRSRFIGLGGRRIQLQQQRRKYTDLHSLGLAGYTPSGIVQSVIEQIHLGLGLPWWGSIVCLTVATRVALLPLWLKVVRHGANMALHGDQFREISERMQRARKQGDQLGINKEVQNLKHMYATVGNPLKGFLLAGVQMPVFITYFLAINGMAGLPVPEFQTDGPAEFLLDISSPDPFYVLPIFNAACMLLNMELGSEAGNANAMSKTAKNVFRVLIPGMVYFMGSFPAACFVYWSTSSFIVLIQGIFLRSNAFRRAFHIPIIPKADLAAKTKSLQQSSQSFMEGFKSGLEMTKAADATRGGATKRKSKKVVR